MNLFLSRLIYKAANSFAIALIKKLDTTPACCYSILLMSAVTVSCSCMLPASLSAQSLVYENYTVNDGLAGQTVYSAFQDSKGFMWFATDAGASRFDGVHFENFNSTNGLPDDELRSVNEDASGRIWFLSFNGKMCFLKDNKFHTPDNDTLVRKASGNAAVFSFYQDNGKNVWFSTASGIIVRVDTTGRVSKYEVPAFNEESFYYSFYETPDNELWIIGQKDFFKFEKNQFVILSGPVLKTSETLPYYFISKGNALFLSDKGLERLINKDYGVIIPDQKIPFSDKALALHYTSRNDIWITNQKDQTLYYKYDNGSYLPYRVYLTGNAITTVYTDREKNTWFCSAGNGVFKLPAASFSNRSFTSEDGLSQNNISTVNAGPDSSLWVGFPNGIVNRIKQNKTEIFDCNFSGKNYNKILQIMPDKENNIWVATDDGVVLIKKIYEKKYAPPFHVKMEGLPGYYPCNALAVDNSGHLFTSWNNGIGFIKYTDQGYIVIPLQTNRFIQKIYTLFFDVDNTLWLSTNEGLCSIENDTIVNNYSLNKDLKDRITNISETTDGTLILATYGNGILLWKNGKIKQHINIGNGLSGNICKKIYAHADTVYVATDKGLSMFVYNASAPIKPENFTTSDGLLSNGVNDVNIKLNNVYVATSEGISILPISPNRNYAEPPNLYITSFKVNTTLMDSLQNVKLSYDRQYLQFTFVAPTFDHPELLTYQYKLSGLNEKWSETKNNAVEFTSLNPGVYVFQVRARKYNSDWSKPEVLKFEITAPFWEEIWFKLVVANSLILIFYFLLRNMVARKYRKKLALYEQQRALQLERNRISTDMHDDLGADLTNIVILSKIARKTLKIQEDQNHVIDRIGLAANDVINKMNEIIWAMNPANDTLSNLVSYLHRYTKEYLELYSIPVQINMPAAVPAVTLKAAFRRNVFLILKESLHNIVKHAHASRVTITIESAQTEKIFRLTIQDNGQGFSITDRTGSGNGLINMKKRMTEINGTIHMVSSENNGAIVNVVVPF